MGVDEVSKLACDRGCNLQMAGYDGVLLYWIENSIFVSKPFDRLDELVDLILRLPICGQDLAQFTETVVLPQGAFCNTVLLAA